MSYRSIIDISVKNNSHTIAIDFIAQHSQGASLKILDVGCSEGYLGEYLRGLGHYVVGVEININAAVKAEPLLDRIYKGTVQNYFNENIYDRFDVIIFGDVLEHITDPQSILEICSSRLLADGILVASLPNVAHISVRSMLLEGRWEYTKLGILDETHIRFFTKKSAIELFKTAGFDLEEVGAVELPAETVSSMCGTPLNTKYLQHAIDIAADDPSASVFQYVFKLKVAKHDRLRVVAYTPSINSSLFDIRLRLPLMNWSKRYQGNVRFRSFEQIKVDDLYWGDVFIFQRIGSNYVFNLVSNLKLHGKKVIFDIDDYLLELPEFLDHHRLSSESKRALKSVIHAVDYVSTSTNRLASKLNEINQSVRVIENCSNPYEDAVAQHNLDGKITLLVSSTDSVRVDFLIPSLIRLQNQYPSLFKIVVVGPPSKAFTQANLKFAEHENFSYEEFKKFLASLTNPIGLIPLDDSVFSSCKSPIKFFDYSLARIPTICSKVAPYSDVVVDGITGLLVVNTMQAWIDAILLLSLNYELRTMVSDQAVNWVKEFYPIDKSGNKWQSLFADIAVMRIDNVELLKPETYQVSHIKTINIDGTDYLAPKLNYKRILKEVFHWNLYKKVFRIYCDEGVKGLTKRLNRG